MFVFSTSLPACGALVRKFASAIVFGGLCAGSMSLGAVADDDWNSQLSTEKFWSKSSGGSSYYPKSKSYSAPSGLGLPGSYIIQDGSGLQSKNDFS